MESLRANGNVNPVVADETMTIPVGVDAGGKLYAGKDPDVNQLKDDLDDKIDKPSTTPEVGKILKVTAVNDDGTFTCEWADSPSGGVNDVTIKGSSIVSDNVAVIPLAKNRSVGVVTINYLYGIQMMPGLNDGTIAISKPSEASILGRGKTDGSGGYKAISVDTIDFALKCAMTDGKGTAWTDAERLAALLRMGCTVDDDGVVRWTAQEV